MLRVAPAPAFDACRWISDATEEKRTWKQMLPEMHRDIFIAAADYVGASAATTPDSADLRAQRRSQTHYNAHYKMCAFRGVIAASINML
jgi:hypothetical protein